MLQRYEFEFRLSSGKTCNLVCSVIIQCAAILRSHAKSLVQCGEALCAAEKPTLLKQVKTGGACSDLTLRTDYAHRDLLSPISQTHVCLLSRDREQVFLCVCTLFRQCAKRWKAADPRPLLRVNSTLSLARVTQHWGLN